MWARFKRAIRAWVGAILSAGEDPKQMLEQNLRDMQDQLTEIKASEARALGTAERLKIELGPLTSNEAEITNHLKSTLENGSEEEAVALAVDLNKARGRLEEKKVELEMAKENHKHMAQLREGYEKELKRRTVEAKEVIKEAEAAKLQEDLASLQQSFEVADIAGTHDEMMDKLRREKGIQSAPSAAVSSSDSVQPVARSAEAEKKFEDLESQKLLEEFKKEMGMSKEQSIQLDPLPDKEGE